VKEEEEHGGKMTENEETLPVTAVLDKLPIPRQSILFVGLFYAVLLNVHRARDVRQIEIQTAELLVPDPSPFEIEIAIAKRFKSPGSDQIPADLIQAGGQILRSKNHKLIKSIWNKEELPDQWKESIIVPVHKKGDKTDCSNDHC
jgi:hypothetical protein